ncbi:LysR substrate-binding domain-containing protein [Longimicrobium sp.]|uniref:LysR substrate-binding domain-containing protein n=1 Tax=Longimicrobium sp. TaxID=2029185 RepID=UPI003B3A8FF1
MSTRVHLRHLRYFVALAEELHFGRAARRLRIAQPALSQQIRALEEAIGCVLVERRPQVALTDAGRVFLEEARQTLARMERGIEATQRMARGESGALSVGFAASAVLTRFSEIIRHYREGFPAVALDLRELSPAAEVESIRTGAVDVAFVREIGDSPDLVYSTLFHEPLAVLLPPGHPLAAADVVDLRALAGEAFVHFPREIAPSLYDQVLLTCRDAGFLPRVVQQAREWLTELSLVQAGLGVALVPRSFERIRWGEISVRPLRDQSRQATIALCHRREGLSGAAAAFAQLARDVASDEATISI